MANQTNSLAIMCCGTLMIIEAKRNSMLATEQVKKQVNEFLKTHEAGISNLDPISLTWDEVIFELDAANEWSNNNDVVLDDYVSHIRKRVPSFFPILTFSKIQNAELAHIRKRLERFAENYHGSKDDVIYRGSGEDAKYWVKLADKDYVKELCYQCQGEVLTLHMYPGNTVAQGYSLFQSENKLSIFNCSIIEIDKENLPLDICAELKISDSWGRWKFNVEVNTKNSFNLKEIFNHVCGRKTSDDRDTLNTEFKKHPGILSFKEFSDKYKESFKREDYSYTFLISLTLHVEVDIPLVVMKKIDIQAPNSNKDDLVVKFTKRIVDRIYELIRN